MNKILIWGTGTNAKRMLRNGIHGDVKGFIETNVSKDIFMDKPVYAADMLPNDYDYILVTSRYVKEIYETALEKNISTDKMIFLQDIKQRVGCMDYEKIADVLGEKNYTEYCLAFNILEQSFFEKDMALYQKMNHRESFAIKEEYLWPVLSSKYARAGTMNNYFWQDLWAARKIIANGAKEHYDIGSRFDGFITHILAAGIKTNMIDIRPFPGKVDNLYTIVDDATELKQFEDNSIESLSALCSLEHFGLGRYGDAIDPEGCFKCFANIQKKMKLGGDVYISLPIGRERVEFNAHRVFYASTVIAAFDSMELIEFSCTAKGELEENAEIHKYDNDSHHGDYRYGLFHFRKIINI